MAVSEASHEVDHLTKQLRLADRRVESREYTITQLRGQLNDELKNHRALRDGLYKLLNGEL